MSAAHAIAMAVTAASVAIAHRVKKVLQNTPRTAHLLSTTTRQTSKPRKRHVKHVSRANNVNLVVSAKNATSALSVHLATLHMKKLRKQHLRLKPQRPPACLAFKASLCHWQKCKPWRKAAVWNGSTPIQNASPPCKPPSQPSLSPCMCHASAHRW